MEIITISKIKDSKSKLHKKTKIPKTFTHNLDINKMYNTTYLAPHQSLLKKWEYGVFLVKGCWLTSNQIVLNYIKAN